MKLLFDFFTIILFFVLYKLYGMHAAIISAMLAYSLQTLFLWLFKKKIEPIQLITLGLILLLGGATFLFKNDLFFKWKPTAIYWLFTLIFASSHFLGKKLIIQHLMDKQITLPTYVWKRLNISWLLFFALMGVVNLYVAYSYNTDFWVNFKLFGFLGITFIFIVLQAFYLNSYQQKND